MSKAYLETANVEGEASEIGRDPRQMTKAELAAVGHYKRPLLAAIRQNCIECCGGSQAEVRRCRIVTCPMWPYRMGANPFARRELSYQEIEQRRDRMRELQRRQAAPAETR